MPAHFLSQEAAVRFQQARLDAVVRIGEVAAREGASFVVVAGDVFDTNLLSPRTVARAAAAMGRIPVPVLLLPGNHDPLDPTTIYRRPDFLSQLTPNVRVLAEPGVQAHLADVLPPGVEVVAAPWTSRHPADNPLHAVLRDLPPAGGAVRVAVGHGGVDAVGGRDELDILRLEALREAVVERRVHYIALGDRHSTTRLDGEGRIFYAGTPEPTAFDEVEPGNVLVVDVDAAGAAVRPVRVATWRFVAERFDLARGEDVEALAEWFSRLPDQERTAVRLEVTGAVTLEGRRRLDQALERAGAGLASLDARTEGLLVRPDEGDLSSLAPGSLARRVAERLRAEMAGEDREQAAVAEAALALLLRLGAGA
ncbi:MAG: metallophosphoesterase [Firmicutes bacterium]|nr:metallophosphoesterase [Bacillota bacterium]